jgi:hypothetical protein
MRWFLFALGALATFRLAHLVSKERGPLAVFERIRKRMPGGPGSVKEWLSCIFCFSLTSSARLRSPLDNRFEFELAGMVAFTGSLSARSR